MMMKRFSVFGLPVVLLALGLVVSASLALAGCEEEGLGEGDGGTGSGGNDRILDELIGHWKEVNEPGNKVEFDFTTDKLLIPAQGGECEFFVKAKHISYARKETDSFYGFCEKYAVDKDGKLTLTGLTDEKIYVRVSCTGIVTFDKLPYVDTSHDKHLPELDLLYNYRIIVAPDEASWIRPGYAYNVPPPAKENVVALSTGVVEETTVRLNKASWDLNFWDVNKGGIKPVGDSSCPAGYWDGTGTYSVGIRDGFEHSRYYVQTGAVFTNGCESVTLTDFKLVEQPEVSAPQ
jgi:hypothetical protein